MALFENAIFSVGVKRADGTVLDHEEVVNQLNECVTSSLGNQISADAQLHGQPVILLLFPRLFLGELRRAAEGGVFAI